ncbi:DUF732 domain-containing protein [Mycobacterium sp.]|uniref:DUF732 domain-containing protein n=1 Tax=Mycobacterium sp. TaxID=1785 RepID=UPI001283F48F|nr:DUF732 domain-containing protein [Mycobacterium sp.]KAA8964967.1 MAG: DUF732 domain-containing protein [Mycobacterium sp.]
MSTGIGRLAGVLVSAPLLLTAATVCGGAARADPDQDERFLALLDEEQIPAADNVPGLIARAHEICRELDDGTSFYTIAREEMNTMYGDNPSLRLVPARVTKTVVRFVAASVDVYCPNHQDMLP